MSMLQADEAKHGVMLRETLWCIHWSEGIKRRSRDIRRSYKLGLL